MALTKAQLKEILSSAGIPSENVEDTVTKIMDGHVTSINALREERDNYKADAERVQAMQEELESLRAKNGEEWQQKYERERADFKAYKDKIVAEATERQKAELYTEHVLKASGIDEKRFKAIMRLTDLSNVEVKDGQLTNVDKLIDGVKTEWADYIPKDRTDHASPETPPNNNGDTGKSNRAAQIANEYHKNLYGEKKGE